MIRQYEAVYVFDSTLEDAAITDKLGRLHGLLGNPSDLQLNHWGRRQLAYAIGRRESGYYVIARFGADTSTLPEYERAIKLDDGVVRHLITRNITIRYKRSAPEEELAIAARRREADDDEDEE